MVRGSRFAVGGSRFEEPRAPAPAARATSLPRSASAWGWGPTSAEKRAPCGARQGQRPSREARKRVGVGPHAPLNNAGASHGDSSSAGRVTAVALLVLTVGLVLLLPLAAGTRPAPRDVVIVAHEMAFYLEGDEMANPTIHVRPGEQVRVVFRNDDAGIAHNFAVADWKIETSAVKGKGETSVIFRIPERPGRYAYVCVPHASMMAGTIEVAAD